MKNNFWVFIIVLTLMTGGVIAIFAFPSGTTDLRAQTCNTEISSVSIYNFTNACTGTYPAACPTDRISCNDATTQTATTATAGRFGGIRVQAYNNTPLNCGEITNVRICYEWWVNNAAIQNCSVAVDANNESSYSNVSTTCPGTTANPGTICLDVTSSENWTCGSFFGSATTRAFAILQYQHLSGGAKTLTADALYFNVTYVEDNTAPSLTISYPTNSTYNHSITSLNSSASDPNLQACWYSLNNGNTNTTFTCNTNITGLDSDSGSKTWQVWANDSYGNMNNTNVTFNVNFPPVISNATISTNLSAGSSSITIYANTSYNGVNDTEANTLNFYCDDSVLPDSVNTECIGGLTSSAYPYNLSCVFTSQSGSGNYAKYCRVYDSLSYSPVVFVNYTINATSLITSIVSVAGDATASYIDNLNDGLTDILVLGESGMSCRWSSSDSAYGVMNNTCTISGTQANCSVNNVASQGFTTRYVSCANSLGIGQTSVNNLDVPFYLDYTAPTTNDSSNTDVHLPEYAVNITEADNVDSDPKSYYCTSSSLGCNPTTSIDNGGQIIYTSSNRGANYLRYYSVDFAGNTQIAVNKTININQLPNFTSALDNAITIQGGISVTIITNSSDLDSGQTIKLYVCNSTGANSSGCSGSQYCSATGTANLSCGFASESDTTTHTWYAYIFDALGESASANPITGSYTTDTTVPTIIVVSPLNQANSTQNSMTFTIGVNEPLSWAAYSINSEENVTMTNTSLLEWTASNTTISNGNYNLTFYANDSYNNLAYASGYSFTIDSTAGDTTKPEITIWSPVNNSYYSSAEILLNISSDEALSWAGYKLNSDAIVTLGNTSTIGWNATLTLTEGQKNITFYANDSSSNENSANKSISFYVDLNNPSVDSFVCNNPINNSKNVNCSATVSDTIGLSYAIIGYNTSAIWQNSSSISLTGKSATLSYIIPASNTSIPGFTAQIYLFDLSDRNNLTESYAVTVSDDSFPEVNNITYSPNTTAELDPDVLVNINATIVEDYNISSVFLMYRNSSASDWTSIIMTNVTDLVYEGESSITYNASFIPQTETWYFKINATDTAGNQNISSNYTLVVANETGFWNGTDIPATKSFSYAQRSDNNTLGILYLNNTGDSGLDFNLSITASSTIEGKININYTNDDNASYSVASNENISLNFSVNTTGITTGLYPYNITIESQAGTNIYEKQIYIQVLEAPSLQISMDTFSSSVTTSQTGISYAVSVTNLGTQDASNVVLTWTLPSIFTLASGNLTRSFSSLPIGSSGTNTLTVNVADSTSDISYYINASATSSNAESVNISKTITVSNPVTITQVVTTTTGGGGGGGGISAPVTYAKIVEVVRGKQDSFDITINNSYNSSLEGLILKIDGFLPQYITISPETISISPKGIGKFNVKLQIPAYEGDYKEYALRAVISGQRRSGITKIAYSEIQNIRLIVEGISKEESNLSLFNAEKAISDMKTAEFNIDEVSILLAQAKSNLSFYRNTDSQVLSQQILDISNTAFKTNNLIRRVAEVMQNPDKSFLLVGNAIKSFTAYNQSIPLNQILTGKTIFGSSPTKELLDLAIAAFDRGDYFTAQERANSAQASLLLERKGNVLLFIFLYWPFIIMGMLAVSSAGFISYKLYRKSSVTRKIQDIDKEEDNIGKLMISSQKSYFTGKISAGDYHKIMNQHQSKLAKIRQERVKLRNKRVKMLKGDEILQDLRIERIQVEKEIKKLQEQFYVSKKISEDEYETEFDILNGRLAEIEEEKITFELLEKKKPARENRKTREEKEIKEKIKGMLK